MFVPEEVITNSVTFTQSAADAVRNVITEKNLAGYVLRLYLTGGGCSGYQYNMGLDNKVLSEDTVIETDGIKLVIDEVSIKYLQGAKVDYMEGKTGSGFTISNPNAVSACSCGQESSTESSECCGNC